MSADDEDISMITGQLSPETPEAWRSDVSEVYGELRRLAARYLSHERSDHTLQATALVHEAYLRLCDSEPSKWNDREHFFRVAAKTMRRILINYAMSRGSQKRGGDRQRLELQEVTAALPGGGIDLLDFDQALSRLQALDPKIASVAELRLYGGCTNEEIAQTRGVSVRSVERDWKLAKGWLKGQLGDTSQLES